MIDVTGQLRLHKDSCSVYELRNGEHSLLIDCGTNLRPDRAAELGIGSVEVVLLTHFHRDQCSSAHAWQQAGAEVILPFAERRFFEETDVLKANYNIYDNYTSYYEALGPLTDLRADRYAYDYETIEWRGFSIDVIPLPGHTFGSTGYRFEVDGQQVMAVGDTMSAPGKISSYFSVQWGYMGFKGHVNLMESLKLLEGMGLDLILPGHGTPFPATAQAIEPLRTALETHYRMYNGNDYSYYRPTFKEVTPHVFEIVNAAARTYVVKDDDGHGLFIDCGYTAGSIIHPNPHRYIDNLTSYLEPELGVREVEWFLPTHYHDDHLAGCFALQNRYGMKVACTPELKDIIEHPDRYDMPCTIVRGTAVDHVIERGDVFHWRGIDFRMEQHPGQTLLHHLIWFEADGKSFLSIGDNAAGMSFKEGNHYVHPIIPKNRTPVNSYGDMPRQLLDTDPDFLLTGHGGAVAYDKKKAEGWRDWMDSLQSLYTGILDQPHPNVAMDPHWVEFYPYKIRIQPGDSVTFQVRVTNHEEEARTGDLVFRSVDGVKLSPERATVTVEGGAVGGCEVTATFPERFTTHSLPVVADVTWNGRYYGEIAEAIVTW